MAARTRRRTAHGLDLWLNYLLDQRLCVGNNTRAYVRCELFLCGTYQPSASTRHQDCTKADIRGRRVWLSSNLSRDILACQIPAAGDVSALGIAAGCPIGRCQVAPCERNLKRALSSCDSCQVTNADR